MRGKQVAWARKIRAGGITPAGAGKTLGNSPRCRLHEDHPRRCGENFRNLLCNTRDLGSPPQVRGKRTQPAISETASLDHPRGCGENYEQLVGGGETLGSPPRMRGKPQCRRCSAHIVGITPADAGKTLLALVGILWYQDHPRGCGENKCDLMIYSKKSGSPPRMRGKQGREAAKKLPGRITPADAGKTIFESRQAAAE